MGRNGKIARLPLETRQELSRRLEDGQPGVKLLDWLNGLPEVQAVLSAEFGGRPINAVNLTQWRQGGHEEWRAGQELNEHLGKARSDGPASLASAGARAKRAHQEWETLGSVLAARYAEVLLSLGRGNEKIFWTKLRPLQRMSREILRLRREAAQAWAEAAEDQRQEQRLARHLAAKAQEAGPEEAFKDVFGLFEGLEEGFTTKERRQPSEIHQGKLK